MGTKSKSSKIQSILVSTYFNRDVLWWFLNINIIGKYHKML